MLAGTGADVVVVDGDIGMANLGAALGIDAPANTLHDVLSGTATPSAATYEGPDGVYVVPGETALSAYAEADPGELQSVINVHSQADYVLIDVGAGISHETSLPLSLADEVLLVSRPRSPTASRSDPPNRRRQPVPTQPPVQVIRPATMRSRTTRRPATRRPRTTRRPATRR